MVIRVSLIYIYFLHKCTVLSPYTHNERANSLIDLYYWNSEAKSFLCDPGIIPKCVGNYYNCNV